MDVTWVYMLFYDNERKVDSLSIHFFVEWTRFSLLILETEIFGGARQLAI
jgi:hypothetical protein